MYFTKLFIFTLLSVISVSHGQKPYTDSCLTPLLDSGKSMCSQMDPFTQCFIDTQVPKGANSRAAALSTLSAISEVMERFKEEGCDLNEEFNNECEEDFVDCLKLVVVPSFLSGEGLTVECGEEALAAFKQCTRKELPNSYGPCYFAPFVEKIVSAVRELICTSTTTGNPVYSTTSNYPTTTSNHPTTTTSNYPTTTTGYYPTTTQAPPTKNTPTVDEYAYLGESSGYCDSPEGVRYHVYQHCTVFRMEWIELGIVYPPQNVAAGTKFDLGLCGQNHARLVSC